MILVNCLYGSDLARKEPMWLLNTHTAELHYFVSPETIPGGYAILSHVWSSKEDTFQDLQSIRNRCQINGGNPRDFVSHKVREFCKLAEAHGFEYG